MPARLASTRDGQEKTKPLYQPPDFSLCSSGSQRERGCVDAAQVTEGQGLNAGSVEADGARCEAVSPTEGYRCTAEPGHDGYHQAVRPDRLRTRIMWRDQ